MQRLVFVLSFVAAAMVAGLSAQAQPRGDWEVLGEQRSRPGVESLVIEAGRRDGRFDAVKIAVSGGNILLLGIDVTFGNGDRQRIRVRTPMFAGSETDAIELEGGPNGRFIRSVKVQYGSLGFLGRPKVTLLGQPVRGRQGRGEARFRDLGPDWELVSTERASRQRERDIIQLSRRDGRFDAIVIRVKRNDVRFRRVRVVYGNGQAHDLDIDREIGEGEESDVLELRGRAGRFIDRIELLYRTAGRGRAAKVEIWARSADRRPAFRDLGPDWSKIETTRVSRQRDRDTIELSRRDGRFDALLIRVKRNDVRFRRLRVVYGNGQAHDLDIDRVIGEGKESDVLELRGRAGRFIDRIELLYRTAGRGRPAEVEIWAREFKRTGFRPLGPRWDEIGVMRASRGGDRDVIELSRRDGRFDALLIRVKRNDVRFRRVRVVYGNGRTDDLDVDRVIREGEESDVLELRGARGRFLDRIELVYATRGGGRLAQVEIWGRKSLRR